MENFVEILPLEVILQIISQLCLRDVVNFQLVCKSFNNLSEMMWQDLVQRSWNQNDSTNLLAQKYLQANATWKQKYVWWFNGRNNWKKGIFEYYQISKHVHRLNRCISFADNTIAYTKDWDIYVVTLNSLIPSDYSTHQSKPKKAPNVDTIDELDDLFALEKINFPQKASFTSRNIASVERKLIGHTDEITSILVEKNILVSASFDLTIRVWNLKSFNCINILKGHTYPTRCLTLQLDKQLLISGSWDGTLRIWNLSNGNCLHILEKHSEAISCMAAKGKWIVSGSDDTFVKVWTMSGEHIHTLKGHNEFINCVDFDVQETGGIIVSGSRDYTIRVWDLFTGNCIQLITNHSGEILCLKLDIKSNLIISGSSDFTLRMFDLTKGYAHATMKLKGYVYCFHWDIAKRRLVCGSYDDTVTVFEVDPVLRTLFYSYTLSPQQIREMGKPYFISFDENVMVVALRNANVLILNFAAPGI